MADHTLNAPHARALLALLDGVARRSDVLDSAREVLTKIAGDAPPHAVPYVALVTVDGRTVTKIAGNVAIVDLAELDTPDCDINGEVDALANQLQCDIGHCAADVVENLRSLTHRRRVERFQATRCLTDCTLGQLLDVLDATSTDASLVSISGARSQ